jgi:WD40 repeat protein
MHKLELLDTFDHDTGWVNTAAFSPDGRFLVTGSHSIHVWDTSTGKLRRVIEGHRVPIWGVAFSPDGQQIASCAENVVRLWNANTGELQTTLKNHRSGVFDVAYLDHQTLASVSHDKTVRLWNLRTGQESLELTGHAHYLWDLDFFQPTRTLFTGGTGGEIRKWRAAAEEEVASRLSDASASPREQRVEVDDIGS